MALWPYGLYDMEDFRFHTDFSNVFFNTRFFFALKLSRKSVKKSSVINILLYIIE